MIRAFELAVRQLGDPRLRVIIWQSLALSLVLQIAIGVVAWWVLQSFATFQWNWVNETIRWLGGGAVTVLALMLFPASFGIVISIFLLFNCFAIVQWKQYKAQGKWANYLQGEKIYIVLSLVAKSALAWQIFAGTLAPIK